MSGGEAITFRSSPRKRGPRAKDWIPSISAFTRVFDALCAGMSGERCASGFHLRPEQRADAAPAVGRRRCRLRRGTRADHPPLPPPLRGARLAHQRRKGRGERPPRPLAALSPCPRSQAYPLAALAPSPRLLGEGGGEGLAEMIRLMAAPHPPRFAP